MRYYLKTTDPRYVEAFKEIRAMAAARIRFFREKARGWGFDEIGVEDFGNFVHFFKRCGADKGRKGPAIEGFKGGDRTYQADGCYFRYTFHGRNKRATELQKLFKAAPPVPQELQGEQYRFSRRSVDSVFAMRSGLPDGVFGGNRISFAMVYLLDGDVLVCSLPFNTKTDKEAAPAVIPEGFEEITERAWAAEIDRHNAAVEPEHTEDA